MSGLSLGSKSELRLSLSASVPWTGRLGLKLVDNSRNAPKNRIATEGATCDVNCSGLTWAAAFGIGVLLLANGAGVGAAATEALAVVAAATDTAGMAGVATVNDVSICISASVATAPGVVAPPSASE